MIWSTFALRTAWLGSGGRAQDRNNARMKANAQIGALLGSGLGPDPQAETVLEMLEKGNKLAK